MEKERYAPVRLARSSSHPPDGIGGGALVQPAHSGGGYAA